MYLYRSSTSSEQVELLKHFQCIYMRGIPIDVTDEGVPLDGETTALFISRLNLFADAIQEMKSENQFNLPFDINFHAENAEDLGGS